MNRLPKLCASVRRALFLRTTLAAAFYGWLAAAIAAFVAAVMVPEIPRWPLLLALAVGPLAGLVIAMRRKLAEADLVFYVDRRLGAGESIVTAWEVGSGDRHLLDEHVLERANERLAKAEMRRVRPRIFGSASWLVPIAAVTFVAAMLWPLPRAVVIAGSENVRITDAEVLRAIERLPERGRNPEERPKRRASSARAWSTACRGATRSIGWPRFARRSRTRVRKRPQSSGARATRRRKRWRRSRISSAR
jgi:hypothetical protein